MRRLLVLPLLLLAACGDTKEATNTTANTTDTTADTTVDTEGSAADTTVDTEGSAQADTTVAPRTLNLWESARITSDGSQPNFQNVVATADWGTGPFERVTLVMELDSTCFPFSRWLDDRPPTGQNWPPLCDAYDRNYEVTMDDPENPEAPAAIELVRAITPFGGPLRFEIDVTDIARHEKQEDVGVG